MAIGLHQKCQERIIAAAIEGIPKIKVEKGKFLERVSSFVAFYESNNALPKNGGLRDQLTNYIDDYPLIEFFTDIISIELSEHQPYLADQPEKQIQELAGYEDAVALANRLVAALLSLPWHYSLSTKLPEDLAKQFAKYVGNFDLAENFRIFCPNEETKVLFSLSSNSAARNRRLYPGGLLMGPGEPDKWDDSGCYIQQEIEGYVDQYGGTLPSEEAQRKIRSFLGLGVAVGLLVVDYSLRPFLGAFVPPIKTYVHRRNADHWGIEHKLELHGDQSRALRAFKLNTFNGKLDTDQKLAAWANSCLSEMKAAFSAEEGASSILLASQWLLDSYLGTDQLQSFVQAMVALEILLGDKSASDEIGIRELLRNRCAYLIGTTHTDRSKILGDFNEIYKVRSKIVHRGKHRLNAEERTLFDKLRWMCRRVIQEELKLVRATRAKKAEVHPSDFE